jgi:hypothetical protein
VSFDTFCEKPQAATSRRDAKLRLALSLTYNSAPCWNRTNNPLIKRHAANPLEFCRKLLRPMDKVEFSSQLKF